MISALAITDLAISRGERRLFEGFSLAVKAGEAVVATGPNGSGKTSLLRAVAGLLRPDAGEISFGAEDADTARRRGLHLLGHHDGLKSWRPARSEIAFASAWTGGGALDRAIETLELEPLLDLEVRVLSAGQRRRVALARLIASPRPLWLLDEPMAPLDARWRERFGVLMSQHVAGGGMILAAVHDPLPIPARVVEIAPC